MHQAPLSALTQFKTIAPQKTKELKAISHVQQGQIIITRYQQLYQGIPIIGAQITISKQAGNHLINNQVVNGHLFDDIQLDTVPAINAQQALLLARQACHQTAIQSEKSQLQIRITVDNQAQLVYLISFKGVSKNNKPLQPTTLLDAFYLMSQQLGIKTAFHIMLLANAKYWTPTSDFNTGACGVMDAARDLNINTDSIQTIFNKVGIDVTSCKSSSSIGLTP